MSLFFPMSISTCISVMWDHPCVTIRWQNIEIHCICCLRAKLFLKQSEVMSPLSRPISLLHSKHFSLETVADICDTLQVIYECLCVHLMLSRRLLYCLLKAVTDGPPRMQLHAVSICAHNYSALWTALVASPAAHSLQVSSVWPSTIKCHDVHGDDPCSQLISVPV